MYKIGIIGDIHIDSKVSSRKDDYFSTCLEKLEEVANNCKNIIILGDVFNRPTLTTDYFIRLYDFLRYRCTCKGNNFYTIIGNHDVYNELEDTLNKTVLGLCSATEVINIITPEQPAVIENIRFVTSYVKLKTAKEHLKNCDYNEDDVLLLHHYFEDKYEGLLYEDFLNVKCKRIFLGHEHLAFDKFKKEYPDKILYRCGSLLRNSAGKKNFERGIYYFILDDEVKIATLENVKPYTEVFNEKAIAQENLNRKRFLTDINDVISKYSNNLNVTNKFSIKHVLQELQTPDKNMSYIKSKYDIINEVFE